MTAAYAAQLASTRLLRPRTWRALAECAVELVWLGAGGWLSLASVWTWPLGQLLLGLGFWRAFAMLHAAGHRALFRSALANDLAGLALSPFCWLPYFSWKHVHAEHHRWTGWVDKDPTMRAVARGGLPAPLGEALDACWRLWIPVVSVAFIAGTFFVPGRDGLSGLKRRALEALSIAVVVGAHGAALAFAPDAWLRVMGLATFVYLTLGDLSLLAQHVALPMERADGRPVRPKPLEEQARYSRHHAAPFVVRARGGAGLQRARLPPPLSPRAVLRAPARGGVRRGQRLARLHPAGEGPAGHHLVVRSGLVTRPLKFAVVREDPRIEATLVERFGVRSALLCASGGCTAFALAERFSSLELALYDFNPTQLAHIEARAAAIAEGKVADLNLDSDAPDGLSQRGDFEKLFRLLRAAVLEFIAPEAEVERYFAPSTPLEEAHALARAWVRSPYWPAVFALAFTDELLVAMFGPDAVQHAAKGSYPGYFARAFERGLLRDDGPRNPFLQHVFLSRYLSPDAPTFLSARRPFRFEQHLGGVPDVPRLERFGLVHLSNIFDWADEALARRWADSLRALEPGAVVTLRQLNNARDWRPLFGPAFRFEEALGAELLAGDQSLFYERLTVAVRTERT